jgi:23S rRNA pseudouridine2604 synthase
MSFAFTSFQRFWCKCVSTCAWRDIRTKPEWMVRKVTVNKPVTKEFIEKMAEGVPILDTVTRKCKVEMLGKYKFRIILTQGLNRQIRRMCEYLGYKVTRLERIRVMNITLGELKPGEYRKVTEAEIQKLYELIKDSSNETVIPKKQEQ